MIFRKTVNRPKIGAKIKITWLPKCFNATKRTPNPYIGISGVVDYHFDDGKGFSLNTGTSILNVIGGQYKYELI